MGVASWKSKPGKANPEKQTGAGLRRPPRESKTGVACYSAANGSGVTETCTRSSVLRWKVTVPSINAKIV